MFTDFDGFADQLFSPEMFIAKKNNIRYFSRINKYAITRFNKLFHCVFAVSLLFAVFCCFLVDEFHCSFC